ncbi:dienelactone hydrolase family protein [Arthrobacter sp. AL12]|uniref:dienelactone hydrolase family protein n=1 Tax=Arthrobacter sp. AL12 TaxID=3042241 RepID=UPI00249A0EB4|nr:dienelactone hydrolase family protein [Arthrobacter sp. AL12]MDI3211088.1 dienelactone hydrolase family protein [Arthrobacter sp. AL12]
MPEHRGPSGPGETLEGFTESTFSHGSIHHPVVRGRAGPAVILIHEVPGIHPGVLDLGRRLIDWGFTVYLPSMFGRPGGKAGEGIVKSIAKVCISREFAVLANPSSPAAGRLRALAVQAHRECGGPGVGSIGMCMTGSFALAMALEPAVLAPVMSQPALPAGLTARRRAPVGLDDGELARVKARTSQGLRLLGVQFSNDRGCPAERSATLRREFGAGFEGIEIDSSPGNPYGMAPSARCVLTVDLVDTPGHPTKAALERTIEFMEERLRPDTAAATATEEQE